ncbi:uncharacterized protein LOC124685868 isoform X1 [Lolium rigidum]|uniref:uncharacterized protein LOC124685868 isoform X1 n=1 Tax=Lolium rigidum TaxID=89674 RepID=UPI001F5DA942|nr:uncharacterized protein LOC124685868 isoform X1 [Lolium rigidum]
MSEPERRETSRKAAQLHAAQNHCLCSSQFCFSESNKPKPYDSTAFGTTRFQSFREATTQHKPNKDCFKQSLSTTRFQKLFKGDWSTKSNRENSRMEIGVPTNSRHCSGLQIPGCSSCCSASSTRAMTMSRDGSCGGGDIDRPCIRAFKPIRRPVGEGCMVQDGGMALGWEEKLARRRCPAFFV